MIRSFSYSYSMIKTVKQDAFSITKAIQTYTHMESAILENSNLLDTLRFSLNPTVAKQLANDLPNHFKKLENQIETLESIDEIDNFSVQQIQDYFTDYKNYFNDPVLYVQSIITTSIKKQQGIDLTNVSSLMIKEQIDILNSVLLKAKELSKSAQQSTYTTLQYSSVTLWGMLIVIATISFTIMKLVMASIQKPLKRTLEILQSLTEGNLNIKMDINTKDEFGLLSKSLDTMIEHWRCIIGQVRDCSTSLIQTALNTGELSQETQSMVDSQNSQIIEIASAVTQLSEAVAEIAQCSAGTLTETNNAEGYVISGNETVGNTVSLINHLNNNIQTTANTLLSLDKNVDNISTILEVITGIAEQTNLLALNAAIEAARAGEQGRGFAVVADEVRGLAERTRQSIQEIQEMIHILQTESKEAVKVMEKSGKDTQKACNESENVRVSFSDIIKAIEQVSKMTIQVSSASEEQAYVTKNVSEIMEKIKELSEKSLQKTSKSFEESQRVSGLARQLQESVSKFTL